MKNYVLRVLVGLDTLTNSLLGGSPYETISLRASLEREEGRRWACVLCKLLDKFQPNHCDLARQRAYAFWRATIAKYK